MLRALAVTSEKTIEINILLEFANALRPTYFVTILGPTLAQERWLSFDDILAGLPPGCTIVFQFKRPFRGADGFPRFTLNVMQLQVLLNRFEPSEAFLVFCPFERTIDFINAHRSGNLIPQSTPLDVHDVPFPTKVTQKTRTLRDLGAHLLEVTDPQVYSPVEKTWSFERLVEAIKKGEIGRKNNERKKPREKEKRKYPGALYYVHVAQTEYDPQHQNRK